MKRKKTPLKFKKFKIASINFIKGGNDTTDVSVIIACQSGNNCPPPPDEASAINNPCSDSCFCVTNIPDFRDFTISCTC